MQFFRYRTVCATCLPKVRARHRARVGVTLGLAVIGVLALGIVGIVFVVTWRPPFDYGKYAPQVEAARARLASSPCDHSAAIELAETMMHAGDAAGTLRFADKFFAKCGDEPDLRWSTFGAHKQLGQWDAAIEDGSKLIESDPSDKDFRWWRASAYERKGNLEAAARDYEKAIELEPRLTNIPINLADVYERMNRPCDARRTLERYVTARPNVADALTPRIQGLAARCSPGGVRADVSAAPSATPEGADAR